MEGEPKISGEGIRVIDDWFDRNVTADAGFGGHFPNMNKAIATQDVDANSLQVRDILNHGKKVSIERNTTRSVTRVVYSPDGRGGKCCLYEVIRNVDADVVTIFSMIMTPKPIEFPDGLPGGIYHDVTPVESLDDWEICVVPATPVVEQVQLEEEKFNPDYGANRAYSKPSRYLQGIGHRRARDVVVKRPVVKRRTLSNKQKIESIERLSRTTVVAMPHLDQNKVLSKLRLNPINQTQIPMSGGRGGFRPTADNEIYHPLNILNKNTLVQGQITQTKLRSITTDRQKRSRNFKF